MNVVLCDKDFNEIYLLNYYKSVIWNTRFNDIGDFEIYIPVLNKDILNYVNMFYYVYIDNKNNIRIITDIKISFSQSEGYMLTITGHTLNYLLKSRIVWEQTNYTNKSISYILTQLLFDNCIINSTSTNRGLFDGVTVQSTINKQVTAQYYGETLYDVIKGLCEQCYAGFNVTKNNLNKLYVNIFKYRDKTATSGSSNPIIFDTRLNNILNFDIDYQGEIYKNVELITGEGDGVSKLRQTVNDDAYAGLDRFELYVNAQDLSQNEGTAQAITQSQYLEILQQRGLKNLENYKIQNNLNCTIDPNYYTFNVDYQVGDMVTLITPFLSQNVIIKEVTENWGENGYNVSITLDQNIEE